MEDEILENLKELEGKNIDEAYNDIVNCFNTEKDVILSDSNNNGYDYCVYINSESSEQYLITVDENKDIIEIWRA